MLFCIHLQLITVCRDVELTEKLHYSSAVALQGYSLFLALIRAFGVRLEAIRVMIAAPVFGILTTHILYMNFYEFDYGNLTTKLFMLNHPSVCSI